MDEPELEPEEESAVAERSPPTSRIVHATVTRQGHDELYRPAASLFWSALVAGLAILASLTARGALYAYLPPAPWREIVSDLGYSAGFLIVILGRMQLFTEHTVIAILPYAADRTWHNFRCVLRLWLIVLAGNVIGAAFAAFLAAKATHPPEIVAGMLAVSRYIQGIAPGDMLLRAIPAGFLIASIAWIRSAAGEGAFWIILSVTYMIALGNFTHVIAGSTEAFLLFYAGEASLAWVAGGFLLPVLAGNIIGGTVMFATLIHAQIGEEL